MNPTETESVHAEPRILGDFLEDLMREDFPALEKTTLHLFLEEGLSMSEAARRALLTQEHPADENAVQDLCRRTMARVRHIGYHDPLYEAFVR